MWTKRLKKSTGICIGNLFVRVNVLYNCSLCCPPPSPYLSLFIARFRHNCVSMCGVTVEKIIGKKAVLIEFFTWTPFKESYFICNSPHFLHVQVISNVKMFKCLMVCFFSFLLFDSVLFVFFFVALTYTHRVCGCFVQHCAFRFICKCQEKIVENQQSVIK